MAKAEAKVKEREHAADPAAIGALIPTDDDSPGLATLGDDAPPLMRYEVSPPSPAASQGQVQKARRVAQAQAPAPAPAPTPPQASPRRDLARMIPSSHRVLVYRKHSEGPDAGKQKYLNDYSAQDLNGCGTIETFLKKYVVPEYGYGDFILYYHDGTSNKEPGPLGAVGIDPPRSEQKTQAPNGSMSEVFKDFLEYQKQREQREQSKQPQKSAAEEAVDSMVTTMLKKQMETMFSGDSKDGGMGPMLMMMMLERMKPAPAPSIDPSIARLMEKMADRLDAMEQEMRVSQAMVPPPPPPSNDGPSSIEIVLESMRENNRLMIEAFKAQQVQRDPIKDLADMAALVAPQKSESLTIRDVFELVPKIQTLQPREQTSPFRETIDNFRLFKMMQKEFGEDRAPSNSQPEENFWTFARDFVRSDVGRNIAAVIAKQAAGAEIAQQGAARAQQQHAQAQAVARRRAEHAARQRQMAEMQAQQAADRARAIQAAEEAERARAAAQAQSPTPTPEVTSAPVPEVAPVAQLQDTSSAVPVSQVMQEAQPEAVEQPSEEGEEDSGEVSVPEAFLNQNAPQINSAVDEPSRIEAVVNGLQALAASQDFYGVIAKMFGLCKQNRKQEALDHLTEILEFFSDNEVLRPDIPKLVRDDFSRHWKIIRQQMNFPDIPEVLPTESVSAA